MEEGSKSSPTEDKAPQSYWVGQELAWEADPIPVVLFVELPYWLMVPDCPVLVSVRDHVFRMEVRSGLRTLHATEVLDSQRNCIHIGPNHNNLDPELREYIDEHDVPVLSRKCKTVLRVHSRCNGDVLSAAQSEERQRVAHWYLKSFCEAHIEVVNKLVQRYRLATYDYFPYEVSPWDIPVWFVESEKGTTRVVLFSYADWDWKPLIRPKEGPDETYRLIDPSSLQAAMATDPTAGELELLDAVNLMERGDYTGAVRRITTAIEAVVEQVLRVELAKRYEADDVERRLYASQNDFSGRLRQYQKLSERTMPEELSADLEATRGMRHDIVHRGARIVHAERGKAQRSVDTGRWIFNWLENREDHAVKREKDLAMRSLGRHYSIYDTEITPEGVVVHKPLFLEEQTEET